MRLARFSIPGRFEDAYLYMGNLVALRRDDGLNIAPITPLLDAALGHRGDSRELARILFERNDELRNPATHEWVWDALADGVGIKALGNSTERLTPKILGSVFKTYDVELDDGIPLDMTLYNQRLYLGSTTGLHFVDIDFDRSPARPAARFTRRLDARCLGVAARWGAVAASAETEGLFVSFDEFGWAGDEKIRREPTKLADYSRRTSWASFGLYNYESNAFFEPLVADIRAVRPSGTEREGHVFAGVLTNARTDAISDRLSNAGIHADSVDYVWSTLDRLFVHTTDGLTRSLSISLRDMQSLRSGAPFALPSVTGRLVQATSSAGFSVLETDFAVWALSGGKAEVLLEGEAGTVRTYPSSRWFKHVVTTTLSETLLLTAVVPEPHRPAQNSPAQSP